MEAEVAHGDLNDYDKRWKNLSLSLVPSKVYYVHKKDDSGCQEIDDYNS